MLQNLDPIYLIGSLLGMVLGITLHEFAHAWSANKLGDPTPGAQGRLTLNPLAHLDPIGSILILVAGFGWGRAVQVQPRYFSQRFSQLGGMALVALAGPATNVVIAVVFSLLWYAVRWLFSALPIAIDEQIVETTRQIFAIVVIVNIGLALFNMLPIPPLDGFKILTGVLPHPIAVPLLNLQQFGPYLLMGLFILGNYSGISIFGAVMEPPMRLVYTLLLGW